MMHAASHEPRLKEEAHMDMVSQFFSDDTCGFDEPSLEEEANMKMAS